MQMVCPDKMKIVHIITGLGVGGAERIVCDLANKMHSQGHEIIIISLTGDTHISIPVGLTVLELKMSKSPMSLILGYLKVRRELKRIKPDVVHSHMIHANIFSRLMRLTLPLHLLINTAHSNNEGGRLRMLAYRLTDKLTDISTNVSKKAVEEFINCSAVPSGRMLTVYNGIDVDKYQFNPKDRIQKRNEISIDNNTPLIMTVGRLTEAKDYPNLLNAFSKLDTYPEPCLAIIGSGELEERLMQLAVTLNISHRVKWLGLQHNVHEWLSACDVFVLSSAWEGFGLVIAEAMSCSRVVVATNVGGISEVIENQNYLVPSGNPELLSEKIRGALNLLPHEKELIGKQNREKIVNVFSMENIVMQWERLYKQS